MTSEPYQSTLNVSLPPPLKRYVDGKVASGGYESASEFVREAIREKQQREQAKMSLTAKLLEGLDSGDPIPFVKGYFERKKRALIRHSTSKNTRT